jgi:hypothetical protein
MEINMNIKNTFKMVIYISVLFNIFTFIGGSAGDVWAGGNNESGQLGDRMTDEDSRGFEKYVWYNGDKEESIFVALDEAGIYPDNGSKKSNVDELVRSYGQEASIVRNYEYLVLIGFPERLNITTLEEKNNEFQRVTGNRAYPVFYQGPTKDTSPMVLTGEIIVQFKPDWDEARITQWSRDMGIEMKEKFSFSANTYLFNAGNGMRSLKLANQIYLSGQTMYAYPNWWKATELKNSDQSTSIPNKSENPKAIPFISNTTVILFALLIIGIIKFHFKVRIYK